VGDERWYPSNPGRRDRRDGLLVVDSICAQFCELGLPISPNSVVVLWWA
jgi:hypothetical protein